MLSFNQLNIYDDKLISDRWPTIVSPHVVFIRDGGTWCGGIVHLNTSIDPTKANHAKTDLQCIFIRYCHYIFTKYQRSATIFLSTLHNQPTVAYIHKLNFANSPEQQAELSIVLTLSGLEEKKHGSDWTMESNIQTTVGALVRATA